MCDLCKKWKSGKLTAKDAMAQIGLALAKTNKKQTDHLLALSSKILDSEVPLEDRNPEADEKWWSDLHQGEE